MEYSNFYQHLNDELIRYNSRTIKEISLPLSMQLELTSMCNMKCQYCYNSSGKRDEDELSLKEWIKITKEIIKSGGVFQCTFSGGEPLLFNGINKIMELLYADGTVFNLITNGTYLDKKKVQELKQFRWNWIQVSLDSTTPKIHDCIRGYVGGWEKAVNAIKLLKKADMPVHVACVVTKNTLYELKDFVEFCLSLRVDKIRFSEVLYSGRACDSNLLFNYEEKNYFEKTITCLKNSYNNLIEIEKATSYREQLEYCKKFSPLSLIIRPNGDVKIDCVLPFVLGNVKSTSILKIWKNVYQFYESTQKENYINMCLSGNVEIKNNVDPDVYYFMKRGVES